MNQTQITAHIEEVLPKLQETILQDKYFTLPTEDVVGRHEVKEGELFSFKLYPNDQGHLEFNLFMYAFAEMSNTSVLAEQDELFDFQFKVLELVRYALADALRYVDKASFIFWSVSAQMGGGKGQQELTSTIDLLADEDTRRAQMGQNIEVTDLAS